MIEQKPMPATTADYVYEEPSLLVLIIEILNFQVHLLPSDYRNILKYMSLGNQEL